MSGDPDQEYFADGISEDLITGLSRIRWLFVIARNSTFVYKGRAVDVRQVARELGVRYVLEGSVRRAGKRLRISAQLIDAMTGGHHWAEQYDRELGDIFACRMRSPAASSRRSSRVCWPRRAFAHFRGRPAISAPGNWWRARKPMSGGSTNADHESCDRRAQSRRRGLSGLRAGPEPAGVSAWYLPRIRAGSIATRACSPAAEHRSRDRARRLRSVGADRVRLLVHDGKAHRGVDRGVPARRQPQSEFGGRALLSQSRAGVCRAGSRSDRACAKKPSGSARWIRKWRFPRRHCGRALSRRPIAEALRYVGAVAAVAPGLSGRAAPALRQPGPDGRIEEAREFLAAVRLEQPQLSIDWIKTSVPYQTHGVDGAFPGRHAKGRADLRGSRRVGKRVSDVPTIYHRLLEMVGTLPPSLVRATADKSLCPPDGLRTDLLCSQAQS